MSLFDNLLKDTESLFLDPIALDYDYQPKLVPYRESHQHFIASCIKPLFQNRNGKNLFIFGTPGVGKTVSMKHVLNEIYQKTSDIIPIYINCWKTDTPHKIALEICKKINYKFTHNKDTSELLKEIAKILNKKSTVMVLDEIDKLQDKSILYFITEELFRKSIFLITNNKDFLIHLDKRINSRLILQNLEFKPYTLDQTFGILKQRTEYAFVPNSIKKEVLELISKKTFELKDIRTGLFLLKEAAELAESESSKLIEKKHAHQAIEKLSHIKIKNSAELEDERRYILNLIKQNPNKTSKELYELYKNKTNKSYRTFLRKLKFLKNQNWIEIKETDINYKKKFIINIRKDIL